MQSSRIARSMRGLRLLGPLLWLLAFGVTPISGVHWSTWECNLPPSISGTFACYATLDV
jgi:hypothetical protein